MADGPLTKADLAKLARVRPWAAAWSLTKLALYAGAAWLAYVLYEGATIKSLLGIAVALLVLLVFRSQR